MAKPIMASISCQSFQSCNQPEAYAVEVLRCIEQMKDEELRVCREIKHFEEEKRALQNKIRDLTDSLAAVMMKTARKIEILDDLKLAIAATEESYSKIIENSHLLYHNASESRRQFLGDVKTEEKKKRKMKS